MPGGVVRYRQRGGVVAPHLDEAAAARPGADVARVGQQADRLDLGSAVVGAVCLLFCYLFTSADLT